MIINLTLGLGLFLLGMQQIENSIKGFGGHRFKKVLLSSTRNPALSALSGTVVTAIVQSSSMVSLLMLAFVGAGLLPLYNAVGVILGANLGTTFTGWLVTTLGFKLNLESLALPAMGLGALLQLTSARPWLNRLGCFTFGFGLLIFGLDHMKTATEVLATQFDITALSGHSTLTYFLVGTVLSGTIQSSSATMMLTLSALHAGLIDLHIGAALVVGADLGTTSTSVLGALKGNRVKKQLALSHVLFNVIVDLAALFLLLPFLPALIAAFKLHDPLYSLVAFHSFFNFFGLIFFLPFLKPFCRLLNRLIPSPTTQTDPGNLSLTLLKEPQAALTTLEKEIQAVFKQVTAINLQHFSPNEARQNHYTEEQFFNDYLNIKQREGELIRYAIALQHQSLSPDSASLLTKLLQALRDTIYAAKNLKDIRCDLIEFKEDSPSAVSAYLEEYTQICQSLYQRINHLLTNKNDAHPIADRIASIKKSLYAQSDQLQEKIYHHSDVNTLSSVRLSTLLNVNREIFLAHHSLLSALEALLAPASA